jgi:hypothetical protein
VKLSCGCGINEVVKRDRRKEEIGWIWVFGEKRRGWSKGGLRIILPQSRAGLGGESSLRHSYYSGFQTIHRRVLPTRRFRLGSNQMWHCGCGSRAGI